MTDENCYPKMYSNLQPVESAVIEILEEEGGQRFTFEISHVGYERTHGILRRRVQMRMPYIILKVATYPTFGHDRTIELTFKLSGGTVHNLLHMLQKAQTSMEGMRDYNEYPWNCTTTGGE